MRKTYSGEFKAKVVLEIFKEEKSISQTASEYGIHPNQLIRWKKDAVAGLAEVLEDGRRKGDKEKEALQNQVQELYTQLGELSAKLNWLKKNLASNWSRNERLELVDFEAREWPLTVQAELLT
jgi:transposase-like protein